MSFTLNVCRNELEAMSCVGVRRYNDVEKGFEGFLRAFVGETITNIELDPCWSLVSSSQE